MGNSIKCTSPLIKTGARQLNIRRTLIPITNIRKGEQSTQHL